MNEELVTNLLTNGLPSLEGKKAYPRNCIVYFALMNA